MFPTALDNEKSTTRLLKTVDDEIRNARYAFLAHCIQPVFATDEDYLMTDHRKWPRFAGQEQDDGDEDDDDDERDTPPIELPQRCCTCGLLPPCTAMGFCRQCAVDYCKKNGVNKDDA